MSPFTEKQELAIHIINIIILSVLCYMIITNGIQLDCNNCSIEFHTSKIDLGTGRNPDSSFFVRLTELNENWLEGECIVIFDDVEGFKDLRSLEIEA